MLGPLKRTKIKRKPGAHYWGPATPIISKCNGILTDQSIFRYFSREMGQFQPTWERSVRIKQCNLTWTFLRHFKLSTLGHACDCNWSLRFLWGSEFEIMKFKLKIDRFVKTSWQEYGVVTGSSWSAPDGPNFFPHESSWVESLRFCPSYAHDMVNIQLSYFTTKLKLYH